MIKFQDNLKHIIFMILFFLSFAYIFQNAQAASIPNLTGPVVDNANILNPNETYALSNAIKNYYQKTNNQFQILTIKSLEGETIEGYAIRVAEKWKIGSSQGSGILIIAAIKDRKIRIEVGQGLEGEITDVFASQVIRRFIAPQFKEGNFGAGFAAALTVLSNQLGTQISFSSQSLNHAHYYHNKRKRRGFSFFWFLLLFFILRGFLYGRGSGGCLTAFLLGSILGSGRSSGWSGGGFSGGWSGGGGGFSGGGASGSW